jgi:hypothetical protein
MGVAWVKLCLFIGVAKVQKAVFAPLSPKKGFARLPMGSLLLPAFPP